MELIVIGLIILFFIAVSGTKKKPLRTPVGSNKSNNFSAKPQQEILVQPKHAISVVSETSQPITAPPDFQGNVIDVSGESYQIQPEEGPPSLARYELGVPYWRHQYVYAYEEIHRASADQVRFYKTFREAFLSGVYYDVEVNSNYYFILLFDLLKEYDQGRFDLKTLEKQLEVLGTLYPKTRSYGLSFLRQRMQKRGDTVGLARLNTYNNYPYNNNPEYVYWGLGGRYKAKLNLSDDQVKVLNRLDFPDNNFCSIEFCQLQTVKLYLKVLDELERLYTAEGISLTEAFKTIAGVVANRFYKYKTGSSNYNYSIDTISRELYGLLFKHAENALREHYGHKRKLNTEIFYSAEVNAAIEEKLVSRLKEVFPKVLPGVDLPNEAAELELNAQNTSRWKTTFTLLTERAQKDNARQFAEDIKELAKLNKKNPSVENIFFEASKFISKVDKQVALELYIHYLYQDLQSSTFDHKQLTKTVQKSLFTTNEQLHEFERIVSDLIRDKDLKRALEAVAGFYAPKRKKIQLDSSLIKEVREKHAGTVDLLNEYLQDEYEDGQTSIKASQINNEEVTLEIIQKGEQRSSGVMVGWLNEVQAGLLELFAKSNFLITQEEVEGFARSKGLFKNQLIESINEACYETLDDVLIEEEEENYIISESYYQRILSQ